MVLKKRVLKIFEDEMELDTKVKRNYYNIALGVEALASGALVMFDSLFASAFMLSIIPTALLSIRKSKKVNYEYNEMLAKQARVSNDKMDRLSFEDFTYIMEMGDIFEKSNIKVEDVKIFTALMKRNTLNYLRQDITYSTYKKNKKKIENTLIKKSKVRERE